MTPEDWKNLVERAKDSDKDFEILLSEIEPIFRTVAARLGDSRLAEDLVQSARIGVWMSLGKVDTGRPDTIKQFLIVAGVNRMRDSVRRTRSRPLVICDTIEKTVMNGNSKCVTFSGILLQYLRFVKRTGHFWGAHEYIARVHGISAWIMRRKFRGAVDRYLKELNQ